MPKPDKLERGTPEYALYKAQKKARKEEKEQKQAAAAGGREGREQQQQQPQEIEEEHQTGRRREFERISGPNLTVDAHSGQRRSNNRQRSSSHRRDDRGRSGSEGEEDNSTSLVSGVSRRRRPAHSHAGSNSPPSDERREQRRTESNDNNTNGKDRAFYAGAGGSIGYGYGQQQPPPGNHYDQGSYMLPANSGPGMSSHYATASGKYGHSVSMSGSYGGGHHGPISPVSPGASPSLHAQDGKYGSYQAQGKYSAGGGSKPQFTPPSPGMHAQGHHSHSFGPPASAFTPAPSQYGLPHSGSPKPSNNVNTYTPPHPPPQQHSNSYPPPNTQSGMPGTYGTITAGAADQVSDSASIGGSSGGPAGGINPFQFQTGGPIIGAAVTVGPPPAAVEPLYGGNPAPPPNLDPNHPGPLPGEGAGKVYPPGQAPQQYSNPDYYADVLADTHTSQSLSHSMVAAEGLNSSGQLAPSKPSTFLGGGTNGSGKPPKPSKPSFLGVGLPSLSGLPISTGGGGSQAPQPMPSPALQPYHGTYQSISPLPSPTFGPSSPLFSAAGSLSLGKHSANASFSIGPPAFPNLKIGKDSHQNQIQQQQQNSQHSSSQQDSTMSHTSTTLGAHGSHSSGRPPVSPLIPSSRESSPERQPKYDPAPDARAIFRELKPTLSRPSPRPLIKILPTLTPPQLNMLRREYKSLYHGVNLAKHAKSVFTTSTPFGKLLFAVALGPYGSEAWFANSWYQKKETRNELLIESLMGRSPNEVAKIKAAFRDAKYDASLEKAVKAELHSNKFRHAVLLSLDGRRMEDGEELDALRIRDDVDRLGNILEHRREGGETEMIDIIVTRSDKWLRQVAALYREVFGRDLMKAIMKRSKNLVGETLLHVLNGAVDRPLRDAKLLDQACTAVMEENREDLLISRSTRIHWEPKHLERVKKAFRKKYRVDLGDRIKEAAGRGSYSEFLLRMMRE